MRSMAKRRIVKIDEEKCNGCALCVSACAEAAIEVVNGKARLVSDVYCDGLGACLGTCPQGAITIEEREADVFDERAAAHRLRRPSECACPSAALRDLGAERPAACPSATGRRGGPADSGPALRSWPIQLALAPPQAPFLKHADLVLAADCTAFARPAVLAEEAAGRPVLIACPKLDDTEAYVRKLAQILTLAHPRSVTLIHMTVPCCHGLAHVLRQAMVQAEATIPVREVTIGIEGQVAGVEQWSLAQARRAAPGRQPCR